VRRTAFSSHGDTGYTRHQTPQATRSHPKRTLPRSAVPAGNHLSEWAGGDLIAWRRLKGSNPVPCCADPARTRRLGCPALTDRLMTQSGYLPDLVLFFEFGGCLGAERAVQPGALDGRTSRFALRANRSAQNQQVKPVASGFRVRCVLGISYGTAETFFAAEELLLSETAHRGIGVAERVHLAEKVREADRPRLTNLLKCVLVESRGRERLAGILDRRVGIDRPSGLREPSNEFNPVQSAREALSNEDRGTGAQNPADLVRGDS
jgi:hypothetical protein